MWLSVLSPLARSPCIGGLGVGGVSAGVFSFRPSAGDVGVQSQAAMAAAVRLRASQIMRRTEPNRLIIRKKSVATVKAVRSPSSETFTGSTTTCSSSSTSEAARRRPSPREGNVRSRTACAKFRCFSIRDRRNRTCSENNQIPQVW